MQTVDMVPFGDWEIDTHVAKASFAIRGFISGALAEHDLKTLEWRIMESLASANSLSICELSERIGAERTFTGRTVEKLAERGLVRKKTPIADRRFVEVSLSGSGKHLLGTIQADISQARSRLLRGIEQDKLSAAIDVLTRLCANAHEAFPDMLDEQQQLRS